MRIRILSLILVLFFPLLLPAQESDFALLRARAEELTRRAMEQEQTALLRRQVELQERILSELRLQTVIMLSSPVVAASRP